MRHARDDRPGRAPRSLAGAALACVLLLLSGCGLGFLYPRLDTVAAAYIEGLVSLDSAQEAQLEATLSANLEWHRSSELGRYATFLRDLAAEVGDGPDAGGWGQASEQAEQYWRNIFAQAAPGYAAVASTLTDAQVTELLASLARRDEERWNDYAERTPAERVANREKSVLRNVERFTGRLTPEQRALVRQYAEQARPFMPAWRENRRAWRAALADALAARKSGARFEARMYQLIAEPDTLWIPSYRAAIEQRRTDIITLLSRLDGTLTASQRVAARRELLSLADELQALASRRG